MSHHITNRAGLGALVMHPGELLADGPTMTLNWILSWADDLLLTDNPSIAHSLLGRSEESVCCCGHEMKQFSSRTAHRCYP